MKTLILITFGLICNLANAQLTEEILASMPMAVSNNAITSVEIDGQWYVYSFGGIDTTKIYSGIHKHVYKYDVANNSWLQLEDLPDGNGRIAAAASTVHDKIYVIGGYEVASNGNEKSFNTLHIFDPITDKFLANGPNLPYPIDDHVQLVYRDSLIYVITGWSNTTNVPHVQIYNPTTNSWSLGSSVPNNSYYRVFGASGAIIGDTIYYIGGAYRGNDFPLTKVLRKGWINPDNPYAIKWSKTKSNLAKRYRSACINIDDHLRWFGGSTTSYNYDGIAYNGSGIVSPSATIAQYNPITGNLITTLDVFPSIMDLRGIAKIGERDYIIAGGMDNDAVMTNTCRKITFAQILADYKVEWTPLNIFPNPVNNTISLNCTSYNNYTIYNQSGELVQSGNILTSKIIEVSSLNPGNYYIIIKGKNRMSKGSFIKI